MYIPTYMHKNYYFTLYSICLVRMAILIVAFGSFSVHFFRQQRLLLLCLMLAYSLPSKVTTPRTHSSVAFPIALLATTQKV